LTMATRAKPGVDVFIYWSAFRWGDACDWYPGFSPGIHNEPNQAENEPNHAAEAEPALRLHIGADPWKIILQQVRIVHWALRLSRQLTISKAATISL
jgi:hypothetical protein